MVNAFAANSTRVTRYLIGEARRIANGKTALYFKRHYNDGKTRASRVAVNKFVSGHIERNAERQAAAL